MMLEEKYFVFFFCFVLFYASLFLFFQSDGRLGSSDGSIFTQIVDGLKTCKEKSEGNEGFNL